MKLSLLELTQNILSRLDSDEVNSINDSAEARQVAQVVRNAYFNIIARSNLPEHEKIFSLDASGSDDNPTIMLRPENVSKIKWIKYNVEDANLVDKYRSIYIIPFEQFDDRMRMLNPSETNVRTFTLDDKTFYYRDDVAPFFCTVYNDNYIIFDSYNKAVDTTLQASKSLAFGEIMPVFTLTDDFTPDLDDQQFPLLINEATSLAFFELKQEQHQKAEQEAKRQWRSLQRTKTIHKNNALDELAHFGRR